MHDMCFSHSKATIHSTKYFLRALVGRGEGGVVASQEYVLPKKERGFFLRFETERAGRKVLPSGVQSFFAQSGTESRSC